MKLRGGGRNTERFLVLGFQGQQVTSMSPGQHNAGRKSVVSHEKLTLIFQVFY